MFELLDILPIAIGILLFLIYNLEVELEWGIPWFVEFEFNEAASNGLLFKECWGTGFGVFDLLNVDDANDWGEYVCEWNDCGVRGCGEYICGLSVCGVRGCGEYICELSVCGVKGCGEYVCELNVFGVFGVYCDE